LALAPVLAEHSPELVMLPWFADGNDDHHALNVALRPPQVCRPAFPYGVRDLVSADRKSPRRHKRGARSQAARLEAHAADVLMDLDAITGLNRYDPNGTPSGQHAEAFLQLRPNDTSNSCALRH